MNILMILTFVTRWRLILDVPNEKLCLVLCGLRVISYLSSPLVDRYQRFLSTICLKELFVSVLLYILVLIVVLPVIIPFSFEGETNFGDNVQATCHVSKGDSPLQLTWSFQGLNSNSSALEESVRTLKVGERTNLLEIPEAFSAHSGNYSCTARNKAGSVTYTATLMVNGNYLEEN